MQRLGEHPNLVVLRTLSKLGLAGIRLGYLAGRPQWIEQFNKVRQAFNVKVLTQAAALFLLERLQGVGEAGVGVRGLRRVVWAGPPWPPGAHGIHSTDYDY